MRYEIFYNPNKNKIGIWFCGMFWFSPNRKYRKSYWHLEDIYNDGWKYIGGYDD